MKCRIVIAVSTPTARSRILAVRAGETLFGEPVEVVMGESRFKRRAGELRRA